MIEFSLVRRYFNPLSFIFSSQENKKTILMNTNELNNYKN